MVRVQTVGCWERNLRNWHALRIIIKRKKTNKQITEYNSIEQGFSKVVPRHTSVPRNFWTVPREKLLGKCEHIKKGLCIKYFSSVS